MSIIKVDTLQTTSGNGLFPSRVWVNFQGSSTVTIRDDGNVSSITDNANGLYTVNYTSSFSNTNYATTGTAVGLHQGTSGSNGRCGTVSPNLNATYSTSAVQLITKDSADGNIDSSKVSISIFS